MITKEKKTFREITGRAKNNKSLLKMFNILVDHDRSTRFMNIFKSYKFNTKTINDPVFYNIYEVGFEEWFDNIAVKFYSTPDLWWVIAAYNKYENPFEDLTPGTNIKILKKNYIYTLLRDLDIIQGVGL
jgi:hypothetical protein